MRVRFIEEAEAELDHAVAHYNALFAGLGTEFAANVLDGLPHIEKFPDAWQLLGQRVRRYRLSRFLMISFMPVSNRKLLLWQ